MTRRNASITSCTVFSRHRSSSLISILNVSSSDITHSSFSSDSMSRSESFASGLISATGTPEARLMSSVTLSSIFTVRTFLREIACQARMQLFGHLFIYVAPLRSRRCNLLCWHAGDQLLRPTVLTAVCLFILNNPPQGSSYVRVHVRALQVFAIAHQHACFENLGKNEQINHVLWNATVLRIVRLDRLRSVTNSTTELRDHF